MRLEKGKGQWTRLLLPSKKVDVLFSYETAVAFKTDGEVVRLKKFYGPTTARHFNQWLGQTNPIIHHYDDEEFKSSLLKAIS